MSDPEGMPAARREAESGLTGAAELIERLADRLGAKASVATVFGDPVVCDGITVIPVATVGLGFGAGAGGGRRDGGLGHMGGGGGGTSATPRGYIEIKDGVATFKPIRDPLVDVVVPLAAALIAGSAAPRIMRTLLGFRHGRRAWRG